LAKDLRCGFCGGTRIIEDKNTGELICLDCGCIVDKIIYAGPEWRAYSYGDRLKRERTGAPITPLLHDLGISSKSSDRSFLLKGGEDRLMIRVLSEIYRISSSLNLPEAVAQTAAILFRKIDKRLKRSRKLCKALPASLLYLSIKIHGVPRSVEEITKFSGVSSKLVFKYSLKLAAALNIKSSVSIDAYISRIVNALRLNGEVENLASSICEKASELGLTQGRNLRAIAAASVYLAAKNLDAKVSQRSLAKVAEVGLSTLRRRLKELAEIVRSDGDIRRSKQISDEEDKSCRKS